MFTYILLFVFIVIIGILYFLFNPNSVRIRKIQSLINKDRSVCDVINLLNGWEINNLKKDALVVIVNPVVAPMYKLYITYNGIRPTNDDIKVLYWELTNENSIVTKAHNNNIPVEMYIEFMKSNKD